MLPPSATEGVAVRDSVVVSSVSVTVVTAGVLLISSLSKLPPLVLLIVVETEPASTYASSVGAATDTEPMLAPAAMLIIAPFDRVTVIAAPAGLVSDAV